MKVTILGLSITSSWGNGHATNYRALVRALHERGDEVTFLERDVPWYAQNRDLPVPPWGETYLYRSLTELHTRFGGEVGAADLVIVGSFVPDGTEVTRWVLSRAGGTVAFYDIDTPVTLQKLRTGDTEYLSPDLIPGLDLYLSFTGGPALELLHEEFGARRPAAFYCFVDADAYRPISASLRWALSYLGTYSAGRQPALEQLLLEPARRRAQLAFTVAGPMYPPEIRWPLNVHRVEHLPPGQHPGLYCSSQFTLNLTRPEMRALGFSPSVRLFEAAACGVPIISDIWPGVQEVFQPGEEIFLAAEPEDVLALLEGPATERRRVADAARRRVLAEHTARRRVQQLHELLRSSAQEVRR